MFYAIENRHYNAQHRTALMAVAFPTRAERDEFVSERKSMRAAYGSDFPPIRRIRRNRKTYNALMMGMAVMLKEYQQI